MKNKITSIGIISMLAILFGTGLASAFMPPSLMPMQAQFTGWQNQTINYIPLTSNMTNTTQLNTTLNTTISTSKVSNQTNTTPAVTITKTLDDTNGQTFGWIASTDPTGLGIRSNMDAGCTMYLSIGGIELYFQPYGLTC